MTKFAFIVHPLDKFDVARKYPIARYLPDFIVESFIKKKDPMVLSEIKGVVSTTGVETEGWFIGCPLLTRQLAGAAPLELVYEKLHKSCLLAEEMGAQVVGLGAFTAVAGDQGVTVANRSPLPVTTGNSYTVATAIEGTMRAAELIGVDVPRAKLAVVGATGSIGKTCAIVMGRDFAETVVVGRDLARTQAVADLTRNARATTDLNEIRDADVVVTVTSSDTAIIESSHLKIGAVVCDVARPRDVSAKVAKERPDVLVIEGGVVEVPGPVDFGMNFGFPPKTAFACMCETMMLALENRLESYTVGKDVSVEQVDETLAWAQKHGFKLAGFRSFEREVTEEAIQRARDARSAAARSGGTLVTAAS